MKAPTQVSVKSKRSLYAGGSNILYNLSHILNYKEINIYPTLHRYNSYFAEKIQIMTVEINFMKVIITLLK